MDSGPVDAAPQHDYDGPVAPPSPQQERKDPIRREGYRSASKRRSFAPEYIVEPGHDDSGEIKVSRVTSKTVSVAARLRCRVVFVKQDFLGALEATALLSYRTTCSLMRYTLTFLSISLQGRQASLSDPPKYLQVGATAGEINGEAQRDDSREIKAESSDSKNAPMDEPPLPRIYKFTLYETNQRYWITGSDLADRQYRMLRIDRTSPPGQIALTEDDTTYSRKEMNETLTAIDDGNKSTGGLRMKCSFWGLLGFIRFTEAYYMLIVTSRKQVAMIGGHYIYQVEGTELIPLTTGPSSRFLSNRNPEEARFLSILNNLDLSKSFYFSYSYDITHSLQHNIVRQRNAVHEGLHHAEEEFNSMFVWNHHLLNPAISALKHPFNWCLPIIHGFIDQSALDIFGRAVYITIIGRRSRFFAGARFLKRGVNDVGYVANDVETEQIVSEKLTTSFHAPGPRLYSNPTYTSYLQHRGSIPLYWTQDNSGVTPKPAIDLNLQDPFYQPAALHFDHLFERYGCPVYVLNLIKARERTPRESKLLVEFQKCIEYLNQSLPTDKRILYKAFDMSRASKTRGGDVIGALEIIAKEIVETTGFFRNGEAGLDEPLVQNGIARTNCIDCLDRTNAAQFVIGKRAFALQLQALGVLDRDEIDFDTDAANIFTHMFHDHGDTIAVQYGGSHLVNTMATYRKLNQWQSQSRDMVESFKRYYHNSFLDSQRQEAYNLFLGNYVWAQGQPLLWDLSTDYYLHHSDPRAWLDRKRRNYIQWYTPSFLESRSLPPRTSTSQTNSNYTDNDATTKSINEYDDYWTECYRPAALSSLGKVYSYRINSINRFLPERPSRESATNGKYDFSPFKIRLDPQRHGHDTPDKRSQRNRVKIVDPQDSTHILPPIHLEEGDGKPASAPPVLGTGVDGVKPADKAQMHLWTLNQFHTQSLHPSVSEKESREYDRYITHPQNLPLVLETDLPSDANVDYLEYVQKAGASFVAADLDGLEDEEQFAIGVSDRDLELFGEFVGRDGLADDVLGVLEDDGSKKRYKAYRQWLRGKSLFKQSKVDPEYKSGM